MSFNRLLLRLSLFANIVLVFWALRQRTIILDFVRGTTEAIAGLETARTQVDEINISIKELHQSVKDQHLRTIASNDQLDAFLAERGRYVK